MYTIINTIQPEIKNALVSLLSGMPKNFTNGIAANGTSRDNG